MSELRTDYKNDILDATMDGKRHYNIKTTSGEMVATNVVLEDITSYTQIGTIYDASDVNAQNEKINEVENSLRQVNEDLANLIIVKTCSFSYTISASSYINMNLWDKVNTLDGYDPIGIVGFATNDAKVQPSNLRCINSDWAIYLYNYNTYTATNSLQLFILYVKKF